MRLELVVRFRGRSSLQSSDVVVVVEGSVWKPLGGWVVVLQKLAAEAGDIIGDAGLGVQGGDVRLPCYCTGHGDVLVLDYSNFPVV